MTEEHITLLLYLIHIVKYYIDTLQLSQNIVIYLNDLDFTDIAVTTIY